MMIRALIFDYGGTLTIKSDPVYVQISKLFGTDAKEVKEKTRKYLHSLQKGEISEEEFWNLVCSKFKSKPHGSIEFVFRKYPDYSKPNEDMVKLVKALKKHGYITALLSNTIQPHADFNRSGGNYDLFSPVILSCEAGMRKPEREIYELALKKIGRKPEECVFIDDEPKYLHPAKELGMKTIHFKSEKQLKKGLLALGIKI